MLKKNYSEKEKKSYELGVKQGYAKLAKPSLGFIRKSKILSLRKKRELLN